MILLIDNYDSFAHNLARYFTRLGHQCKVVRNDAIDAEQAAALKPSCVVISPGPCTPAEAGCSVDVVNRLGATTPILGVCLGHQAIAGAHGARIVRALEPMHGRTSQVFHTGQGIFADLPNPFSACRYHSLVVDESTLSDELEVTARTAEGEVMAVRHRFHPVTGVQFHPESILTEHGYGLLAGFLQSAGLHPPPLPAMTDELRQADRPIEFLPSQPVTF